MNIGIYYFTFAYYCPQHNTPQNNDGNIIIWILLFVAVFAIVIVVLFIILKIIKMKRIKNN